VPSFVNGCRVTLVFVHHETLSFGSHEDTVTRYLDVLASDSNRIIASGGDRGLVHEIRELSTGEARRSTRDPLQVETFFEFEVACVNFQNRFASGNVSEIHRYFTIESSRPCKSFVENIRTVG
jgi:hypothetical protein